MDVQLRSCDPQKPLRAVVEVDGPTHFRLTEGALPRINGSTALKQRQLRAMGWTVASVPYFEWDELRPDQSRKRSYARRLLERCVPWALGLEG